MFIIKKFMGRYLVLILVLILQALLSKAKNRIVGLILPSLSFLASLILLLAMGWSPVGFQRESFLILVILILVFNIPTLALMIIYKVVRRNKKVV